MFTGLHGSLQIRETKDGSRPGESLVSPISCVQRRCRRAGTNSRNDKVSATAVTMDSFADRTRPGPKRIVMVCHSHSIGGIERHVLSLSAGLTAAGHRIAFAGPKDGWLGRAMQAAGHEGIDIPMHGMLDPISAWRLRRFARKWNADILHGHAQRGARYAHWAADGRLPMIATAHSTNAWVRFKHDHQIIAVSNAVRHFLLTKGFAQENVTAIHLGVPDLGLAAAPAPGPIALARPLMLGMLARLEPVKGHDLALKAINILRHVLPVRLTFIGPTDTEWARKMKALTNEMGLMDHVIFQGETADIKSVFDRLDVMLAPSRREALSLSLIEAAASGRPSIGTNVGGIPEVVEDDISGILVPAEDPEALAAAILKIGRDDAMRLRMGRAAREVFEGRFTPERMITETERAYDRAIRQWQERR